MSDMDPLDEAQQTGARDRRKADIAKYSLASDAMLVEISGALGLEPAHALDIGCSPAGT